MIRRIFLYALLLLTSAAVPTSRLLAQPTQIAGTDNVRDNATPAQRKAILAAIDEWKQALIQKDREGFERVFHDDLSYGHSTGEILNKQQSIERNLATPNSYKAIDITDVSIRTYGHFALVTSTATFHIVKGGDETASTLNGLDVWVNAAHGWQLLARQLTRPAH